MTFFIKIKHPKAKKLLEDLASLNLIEISDSGRSGSLSRTNQRGKTETHFASETSLGKIWSTPKEDEAWKNL